MKARAASSILVLAVTLGAISAVGGRRWAVAHVQRWTDRPELGFVACNHCHFQGIEDLPWAKPRPRHPSPAGVIASRDGTKVFIACDDADEVVEADLRSFAITRRLALAGGPCGLALDTDGARLFVTCRDRDQVVTIGTREFRQLGAIEVGDAPVAIAFASTPAGERLIVANSISDNISVLEPAPLREIARPQSGREPYAVAVSHDGRVAFVANRLASPGHVLATPESELTVIDPLRGRLIWRHALESAHLSEGVATLEGTDWALTPFVKVRNLVPITQVASGWVMSSGLAISDRTGVVAQLPLDEAHQFFADPSGLAVDARSQRAFIASGGADVVSVLDLAALRRWLQTADEGTKRAAIEDLSLSAEYVLARIPTGRNPRHLALTSDAKKLLVAERLDDAVLVVNTETLQPLGRIELGRGPANDPIRRGERVFTSAAYTFQHEFSCRSCHPDGHVDGLAYDFDGDGIGDNLLDNRTLQGIAATGPFKWNGKNPSLDIQCGPRFARVLMRSDPIPPKDLRDLITFLESQPPPRWERKRRDPLTASQERGRRIFFATHTSEGTVIPRGRRCHTCHRPPLFTNRLPSAVGTQGPRDTSDLFDTPHLLGLAETAPYLHDGRAQTLEELWTIYQTNDLHGVSSYMNKHQLNDLVEFLKTL